MVVRGEVKGRPTLSVLAMVSFIASFIVARVFTSLFPKTVWEVSGLHVHHFWYGLAMLAIGGWLGISYESELTNRLAAILFGAGGGIVGDEVGLLLTLGDYWTEITYTFVILFVVLMATAILILRYSEIIRNELAQFIKSNASLYLGVFLTAVSVAFIMETENNSVIAVSSLLTISSVCLILANLIERFLTRRKRS